MHIHHCCSDEM